MSGPKANLDEVPFSLKLGAEDIQRFCDYLYRRTGLSYDESKRFLYRAADRGSNGVGRHQIVR